MIRTIAAAALTALALAGCSAAQPVSVAHVTSPAGSSSPAAEPVETPTPEATFAGHPGDFQIGVRILKRTCFGSAGCNVTYRIVPQYVGTAPFPDSGTVEVTYAVKGLEDGEAINTFTIAAGGNASFDSEELGSITSSRAKLTARATDVTYQP